MQEHEQSLELRGRMDEQNQQTSFLSHAFVVKIERLHTIVEGLDSPEIEEACEDTITSAVKFQEAITTNNWLVSLRSAGFSDAMVLRVWDTKLLLDERNKNEEENS